MKIYKRDIAQWLKNLTPLKIWNAVKVYTSFYISDVLKRPIHWGRPLHLSFEPTTACNLRCPECPSGLRAFSRDTGNLKSGFFKSAMQQFQKQLISLIFYFQGEPYINPEFLDMVRYASDRNIYTITSTNAHFLNDENARRTIESGLDRLIISVDGTTQEVYEQYRKEGSLEKVLEGARNIVKWKKKLNSNTPHTIFQFLVVKPNEHQMADVHQLAAEIGIDEVKLKTAQVYDYENGNPLIPVNNAYSRYVQGSDGKWKLKFSLRNRCWRLWNTCVITWDGHVVPCCFDKDARHKMGDLKESTFEEIWKGKPYQTFRYQLLNGRDKIDICTNCTEGCKVFA